MFKIYVLFSFWRKCTCRCMQVAERMREKRLQLREINWESMRRVLAAAWELLREYESSACSCTRLTERVLKKCMQQLESNWNGMGEKCLRLHKSGWESRRGKWEILISSNKTYLSCIVEERRWHGPKITH